MEKIMEETAVAEQATQDVVVEQDIEQNEVANEVVAQDDIQQLKKQLKLKIDGQELEYDVDLSDEQKLEKLQRDIQKGLAADRRFQEASTKAQQAELALKLLQENPEEAMRQLGMDPEQFAAALIERKIKEMEMSPEEKAQTELRIKAEQLEKELERLRKEKELSEKQSLQQKYVQEIDNEIAEALKTVPDLPKSEYSVKRIVDTLLRYTEAGYDVTVKDVLPVVKSQMQKEMKMMIKEMPDEVFKAWLGQDNEKRLYKKTPPLPKKEKKDVAKASTKKEEPPRKITLKEFLKS